MNSPLPPAVASLIADGRSVEAIAALKRLIARPAGARDPALLGALGRLLLHSRQAAQSVFHLSRACELSPDDYSLLADLGAALLADGQYAAAAEVSRRAAESLASPGPWCNLAAALLQLARPGEAADAYRHALTIDSADANAAAGLAQTLGQCGQADDGLAVLAGLHAKQSPTLLTLLARATIANYSASISPEQVTAWHRVFGEAQEAVVHAAGADAGRPVFRPGEGIDRQLRIGLLSPDLREHSVAYFLTAILEHRDRAKSHVTCYSLLKRDDAMSRRLRAAVDAWRECDQLTDLELLTLLRRDGLDVLVDLVGHSGPGRQGVLAAGAAPVQVSAIGYPATNGLRAIDWRLCDSITDPTGSERLLIERPLRLDGCFLCYTPPADLPNLELGPLSRGEPLTFGSFNNIAKAVPQTLSLWARVLQCAPGSRLVLKSRGLDDTAVQSRIRADMQHHGIDPGRIAFLPFAGTTRGHLASYRAIDIALDPFPYHGTTTTCEALLMGVPVVTLMGDRHAARVGGSLLTAAGCGDWVAGDADEYVAIAQRLASDRVKLAALRTDLRDRLLASPLCDGPAYAQRFWEALAKAANTPPRGSLTDQGSAQAARGDVEDAITSLSRAVADDPADARAWSNLIATLMRAGRRGEAARRVQQARTALPTDGDLAVRHAAILLESGRADESIAVLAQAARDNPHDPAVIREWATTLPYAPSASGPDIRRAHQALAELTPAAPRSSRRNRESDRPLRIGFLSGDLRTHSVAFFLEPLLDHLDPRRVETACYSTVRGADAVTARLRARTSRWRDIAGLAADQAAAIIRADRLDALVDLCGPLPGGRPDVLAQHPAALQINWLGYPATAGCAAIDARLVDSFTDPPGSESHSIEPLVRLDPCFLCYKPPEAGDAPDVRPRDQGRPITFGSFNKLAKVNDSVLSMWCSLLTAVPGSRLVLKGLGLEDAEARSQVITRLSAAGIDGSRVELLLPAPSLREHLDCYHRLDVALDTFPYHGTTTTCEALFMGVPVVSLVGGHHAARVGLSLLTAAGLADLATPTPGRYLTVAAALASDTTRLVTLRTSLRHRLLASTLCDGPAFAARFTATVERLLNA